METQYKEARTTEAVDTSRKNTSKFITLVEIAYQAENRTQGYNGTIASLVWNGFSKMSKTRNTSKRVTFKTLLIHLYNEGAFSVLKSAV